MPAALSMTLHKPHANSMWNTRHSNRNLLRSLLVAASVVLFAASLPQDAYYGGADRKPGIGLLCLLFGWLELCHPTSAAMAWLANPALLLTWVFSFSPSLRRAAIGCGITSLCLSLSFLLHNEILADESGHYQRITGYGVGYWLWLASIATAVVACIPSTKTAAT